MNWRAPALCGFAERAGWSGEPVVMAVAVALGASDGDDAYIARLWGGAHTSYVGLWQVPVPTGDVETTYAMLGPLVNAQDAFRRYTDADDTFDWCVGFQTGRWRSYVRPATLAYRETSRVDTQPLFGTIAD